MTKKINYLVKYGSSITITDDFEKVQKIIHETDKEHYNKTLRVFSSKSPIIEFEIPISGELAK